LPLPFRRTKAPAPVPQPEPAAIERFLSRRRINKALRYVLAGGNLAFGAAATVAPAKLADLMDETEEEIAAIGRRDLAAGMAVIAGKGRLLPLLGGIAADAREAFKWLRRKPLLAIFPLVWMALGIGAVLTRD
jgi:hypothetical protein